MERQPMAYDVQFDLVARQQIALEQDSLLRQERLEQHQRYTRDQIITLIGEKYNVLQRVTRYNLIDGELYGENMPEPAINSFRRGRDHKRAHGNPIDYKREDAEVSGFGIVSARLADPNSPVGQTEFFASPPSGIYRHNCYDTGTKKIDGSGREYIEFNRFSSALSYDEYRDFVRMLGLDAPDNPDSAFFLGNPVTVKDSRFKTPEDIHKYLHREHDYMLREEFDPIIKATSPHIDFYVKNPSKFALRVVLNRADEVRAERQNGIINIVGFDSVLVQSEINRLGSKPFAEAMLPCGNLSDSQENSPFSVVEFDITYPFDKFGSCKKCASETALGPCGICRNCDIKSRQEQKLGIAS